MTVRFGNYRLFGYVAVFLCSGTVLGFASHFASFFLPSIRRDFTIYSLIVPSVTIFVFLLTLQWAVPNTEAIALFLLGVLWLGMGSWSMDIIGFIQCDAVGGQRIPKNGNGTISYQTYCYEMKVIEAFSWMNFVMLAIYFIILITLVSQAQVRGRPYAWNEPIRELPWFGEMPGYYGTGAQYPAYPPYVGGPPPMSYPTPGVGSSIVIQPGVNGQPPTVTHVQGTVAGV